MRLFAWQIQGRSATRFYATDLDEFVDFHAWQSVNVNPSTVRALAKALHVRVPDLLVDVPVLKRVRFRSLKRLNRREQVLIEVGQKLRDFVDLETQLKVSDLKNFEALRSVAAEARGQGISAVAVVPCGLVSDSANMS
ncbi:hypothetical protein [Limnohabitans sp.]|jgi:hypothetical protein